MSEPCATARKSRRRGHRRAARTPPAGGEPGSRTPADQPGARHPNGFGGRCGRPVLRHNGPRSPRPVAAGSQASHSTADRATSKPSARRVLAWLTRPATCARFRRAAMPIPSSRMPGYHQSGTSGTYELRAPVAIRLQFWSPAFIPESRAVGASPLVMIEHRWKTIEYAAMNIALVQQAMQK